MREENTKVMIVSAREAIQPAVRKAMAYAGVVLLEDGRVLKSRWTVPQITFLELETEGARFGGVVMSKHDRERLIRAEQCDRASIESVRDAIAGLQSTDHPSLLPLHDELMAILLKLEADAKEKQ